VFVPSVSDYRVIAGLEAADGSTDQVRTTTVWPAEDVHKTQIPEMRLEVHTQALLARQRKSRKALSLVYTCMANIERMMASGALDTVPADVQAKAKTIVERFENELREKLEVHKAAFLTQMRDTFTQAIIPALETGCAFAASDSSIHRVIAHVKVALRTHWHPWRTLFANDGVHPGSNNFVSINSNQMLVDPILEQLTGNPDKGLDATWTPAFGDVKTAHLPNLEQLMKGELNTSPSYNERISVELKKIGVPPEFCEVDFVDQRFKWRTELVFRTGVEDLIACLEQSQDYYADQLTSRMQELLGDIYQESYDCRYQRKPTTQKGINHFSESVRADGPRLLHAAVSRTEDEKGLGYLLCEELADKLGKEIEEKLISKVLQNLTSSYEGIWEVLEPQVKAVRAEMHEQVAIFSDQARKAVSKLPGSNSVVPPQLSKNPSYGYQAAASSSTEPPAAKKQKLD